MLLFFQMLDVCHFGLTMPEREHLFDLVSHIGTGCIVLWGILWWKARN